MIQLKEPWTYPQRRMGVEQHELVEELLPFALLQGAAQHVSHQLQPQRTAPALAHKPSCQRLQHDNAVTECRLTFVAWPQIQGQAQQQD